MLRDATVYATIAVRDIDAAKEFYGEMLGLIEVEENPGGVTYQSGDGQLFVYSSTTAGTGRATCAAWQVEDLEGVIEALKSRGITFEHYDIEGAVTRGDITVMGSKEAAWFKDPDGNILSIGN